MVLVDLNEFSFRGIANGESIQVGSIEEAEQLFAAVDRVEERSNRIRNRSEKATSLRDALPAPTDD